MMHVPVEEIQRIIRPVGLSPAKSKAIAGLSRILVEKHGGQVPRTFEELEELPGVGHKTASVVMSQAFGVPAFPVDTHIHRLAQRWKLTNGRSVEQTEADLKNSSRASIGTHFTCASFTTDANTVPRAAATAPCARFAAHCFLNANAL
ncbi:MAG: hypothetical protein NVV63_00630 [Opitutus sp.]|nr:hypothetical protein [Opitutus sp.]